jgi:hypothetical protein
MSDPLHRLAEDEDEDLLKDISEPVVQTVIVASADEWVTHAVKVDGVWIGNIASRRFPREFESDIFWWFVDYSRRQHKTFSVSADSKEEAIALLWADWTGERLVTESEDADDEDLLKDLAGGPEFVLVNAGQLLDWTTFAVKADDEFIGTVEARLIGGCFVDWFVQYSRRQGMYFRIPAESKEEAIALLWADWNGTRLLPITESEEADDEDELLKELTHGETPGPNAGQDIGGAYLRRLLGRYWAKNVYVSKQHGAFPYGEGLLQIDINNWGLARQEWASYGLLLDTLKTWRNLQGVPLWVNGRLFGPISSKMVIKEDEEDDLVKELSRPTEFLFQFVDGNPDVLDLFGEGTWIGRVQRRQITNWPKTVHWIPMWVPDKAGLEQPPSFNSPRAAAEWFDQYRQRPESIADSLVRQILENDDDDDGLDIKDLTDDPISDTAIALRVAGFNVETAEQERGNVVIVCTYARPTATAYVEGAKRAREIIDPMVGPLSPGDLTAQHYWEGQEHRTRLTLRKPFEQESRLWQMVKQSGGHEATYRIVFNWQNVGEVYTDPEGARRLRLEMSLLNDIVSFDPQGPDEGGNAWAKGPAITWWRRNRQQLPQERRVAEHYLDKNILVERH